MYKKTAILGFGNPVRSDDGVGCYVVEQLKKHFDPMPEWLNVLDMGTSAFEALFQLQGHERIIFVDAVIHSNDADGTVFLLPAAEVMCAVQEDPMVFLHSLKWDQALSYAQKILGEAFPKDVSAYLIAVSDIRLEVGLSETVKNAGERTVQLILKSLEHE